MTKSILDGVSQIFGSHLLPEGVRRYGQAPHFQNGRTLKAILAGRPVNIPVGLFNDAMGRIETNFDKGRSVRESKSLWVLRQKTDLQPKQLSPEVTLERNMVKHLSADRWFNQLATAAGLVGSAQGRRRAVDLVEKVGDGEYRFIELKIASNTPLAAAVEVLEYGLLFAFARKHSKTLPLSKVALDMLSASSLQLRVLAPTSYYDKHDGGRKLGWLEKEFSKSFGQFAQEEGFKADFQFLRFHEDFSWDATKAAKDESFCANLKHAYGAVKPVYP